jgi:hypothetical protein
MEDKRQKKWEHPAQHWNLVVDFFISHRVSSGILKKLYNIIAEIHEAASKIFL